MGVGSFLKKVDSDSNVFFSPPFDSIYYSVMPFLLDKYVIMKYVCVCVCKNNMGNEKVITQDKDVEGEAVQSCHKSHTHGEKSGCCGPTAGGSYYGLMERGSKGFVKEEALSGAKGFGS